MKDMKYAFLPALLAILLLTGCAPEPLVRPDPPETSAAESIQTLIEQGRFDEALVELEGRIDNLGAGEADRLRLAVAEQLLRAGAAEQARQQLGTVRTVELDREDQTRLALAWAELALVEGDNATAGWLLAQVADGLPPTLARRHAELEGRLRGSSDQPARNAVQTLETSLRAGDFEPDLALALLIEFPLATLQALAIDYGRRADLAPWLDLAVTAREFLLDDERLLPALERWQQRHPRSAYQARDAARWVAAWRQIQPPPGRVAVILPGPDSTLARPGRALRDGLLAAWTRLPPERRPELEFFYTPDAAEAVIGAWFSARESGAELVIGPLSRDQVDALLALGDGAVPLLLLNHPSDRQALSRFPGLASAYALTPEEEAELAAARALVDGHRRALILRQDSDWGDRVAESFSQAFGLGGGRIVRDSRYSAAQVDHSILLEVVLGLDRSRERAGNLQRTLGMPLEAEGTRRTDADLIFLAARSDDARALRPQLDFFGAGDLQIMATSHVIAGAPDPRRDQDLDQVLLPISPWFLDGTREGQARVQAERRYDGLQNPTLSRLFALGVDALGLLPWLDGMRADPALYLPGLTGHLSLDREGLVMRDLPFVRIIDGRPVPE